MRWDIRNFEDWHAEIETPARQPQQLPVHPDSRTGGCSVNEGQPHVCRYPGTLDVEEQVTPPFHGDENQLVALQLRT